MRNASHHLFLIALSLVLACEKSAREPQNQQARSAVTTPEVQLTALPMRLRMQLRLEMTTMKDLSGCVSGDATRLLPEPYTDTLRVAFFTTTTETFYAPDSLPGHDKGWTYGVWRMDAQNSNGNWAANDTGPRLIAFAARTSVDSTLRLNALATTKGRGLKIEDRWTWSGNEGDLACLPPVTPGVIMASLGTPLHVAKGKARR